MKTSIKLLSLTAIIMLLIIAFRTDPFAALLSGDPDALKHVAGGRMWVLLLFTLLLMTIQNLFTIIPLLLMISLNLSLFGFVQGYLWSWLTSILGAVISFGATRYWFQPFFTKYMKKGIRQRIEDEGFWFVFIGRIFPFMATSVVNIASGMSSIGLKPFLYATVWGNLIYFLVLTFISKGILSVAWNAELISIAAALLLIVVAAMRIRKRRSLRRHPAVQEESID